jgi:hypothetical protein
MVASNVLLPILPPTGWTFFLLVSDEVAGERGQQMRTKQLGPDLWAARYEASQLRLGQARTLKAIISGLMMQRTLFYGWDPGGQWPAKDKKGTKLTAPASVTINSVNADNQRLSLKGLPVGYVLTRGDYLAFNYGSPVARALHQIWSPASITADALGITAEFFVTPRLRPTPGVGQNVILEQPACEMMIVPGSYAATEGPRTASLAFDALQVLP